MGLPKIDAPIFSAILPSTKEPVQFRPFSVKEEKILLMAAQSEDTTQIVTAVGQILENCLMSDIRVDNMASFDVEYIFMQIRSKSVGNIISLNIRDEDEENPIRVDIDLDDLSVEFPDDHADIIELSEHVSIKMKYPSFKDIEALKDQENTGLAVLRNAIDKVISGEEILSLSDHSDKEVEDFFDSFSSKNMRDVQSYFSSMPVMTVNAEYENSKGEKKTQEIKGLASFFM